MNEQANIPVASGNKLASFYLTTLENLISENLINKEDSVLVLCGSSFDRDVFLKCGFKEVTISNVDKDLKDDTFAPFKAQFIDAEKIDFSDNEFDLVVVHSGLHHCRSPHKALLEMYRVARKGILGFEPHRSLLTKIGKKLNFGQVYEHKAVVGNGYIMGGVRNTHVPNFVYRFDKADIEQTINTNFPEGIHIFRYWYETRSGRNFKGANIILKTILNLCFPILTFLSRRFRFLANNIGFYATKADLPKDLQPWLEYKDGEVFLKRDYYKKTYPS